MALVKNFVANLGSRQLRNRIYAVKEFVRAQPRPILVFQMAKVGSTAVCKSLQKAGLSPLHVHKIAGVADYSGSAYQELHGRAPTIDFFVGRLLGPYLQWTTHRLKVVSLVRDPVARYLSMLYHRDGYRNTSVEAISADVERTAHNVAERLAKPATLEAGMLTWFDREMKVVFDIDVMGGPFNRRRGYGHYNGPRAETLVIKLESLSELLPTVLSDFVDAPLAEVRANVRSTKKRGDEYAQVKKMLRLSEAVLDRIYSHDWVRHFYTHEEIATFRARWS
jgi:hypothetical protein